MPIETLPGHPINYPIQHFQPIPERRPIPTAAYAAMIARSLEELAKNLSPEERARRQAEISILQSKAREASVRSEYAQWEFGRRKQHEGLNAEGTAVADRLYNGGLTDENAQRPKVDHSTNEPDTEPHTYYNGDPATMDEESSAAVADQPSEAEDPNPLPGGETPPPPGGDL